MSIRRSLSPLLAAAIIGVGGCRTPQVYTLEQLGCGAGAYPGHPVQRRAAQWPEPMLGLAQRAALRVEATDAGTGRSAFPLHVWIIQGHDTVKARTDQRGVVEFPSLTGGAAEVLAWQFNYASTRDSVLLRTGLRDTVVLRLGRTGNECYIVPDTGRRAGRRRAGP